MAEEETRGELPVPRRGLALGQLLGESAPAYGGFVLRRILVSSGKALQGAIVLWMIFLCMGEVLRAGADGWPGPLALRIDGVGIFVS